MTDQDIRERLAEGDRLLEAYKELLKPVLEELAQRKAEVLGYPYTGEFGCWEEGIDILCIHREGESRPDFNDTRWQIWTEEMRQNFFVGLRNIQLSSFF